MYRYHWLLTYTLLSFSSAAQKITIPGNTGYSVPEENGQAEMFGENGLQRWTDAKKQVSYFFYVRHAGKALISVEARNPARPGMINLAVAGKSFPVAVPVSKTFRILKAGNVDFADSGFYSIKLSAVNKSGGTIADIQSIVLSGPAAADMHFNTKTRRNAASVHLKYPFPDSDRVVAFFNEVTVPQGSDHLYSYYMACGFSRGYFGIQVNGPAERRVIFSVWDAGREPADRNLVPDSNKVQLMAKGEEVFSDGFGNEGTGGHSHWIFPWKAGETYKMMVTALPDSQSHSTIYTGYIFLPEQQKWKLIASFKAPKDGQPLRGLYSFNENFSGVNGQFLRKAFFGNQWIQKENGQWTELTVSNFSIDATGRAKDRIDFGGGTENDKFYLWNGGFRKADAVYGQTFSRMASGKKPVIDWTRNADSAIQAQKDLDMILSAVKTQKLDTTGSRDGVFYKILKEGTGDYVSVNDTVTVFYKGSLLKDGSIFDQTKDRPATFPLKRLIRGWQVAVPMCRVGGQIRIIIPSALAYTIRSRSKAIPPNSVLVFDIDVLSVKK